MNKSLKFLLYIYCLLSGLVTVTATAGVIDWSTIGNPTGNTSSVAGVGVVKANGGNFMSKGRFDLQGNYWQGFGVSGIPSGEISIGESISIDFFAPTVIESFSLGFLWPKNTNVIDSIDEKASVSVYFADGSFYEYFLQATSWNTATWTGLGSVSNLSPADLAPNAAVWNVKNPFSNSGVSKLVFAPTSLLDGSHRDSDFSIMSVNTVSEPNSPSLFVGLLLLAMFSRSLFLRR